MWKEKDRLIGNGSCASIGFRRHFDEYYNATDEVKVIFTRNTFIRAVNIVKTKVKFDYEMFCQDLQNVTEN